MAEPGRLDVDQSAGTAPSYTTAMDHPLDNEKADGVKDTPAATSTNSSDGVEKKEEEKVTDVEDPAKAEAEVDDQEYPKAFRLAFITIALMLSVSYLLRLEANIV